MSRPDKSELILYRKPIETQKYIKIDSESKLTDFISYFIKSLREEFENGGNKNEI